MAVGVGAFFFVRRRRRVDYQKQWEGSNLGSSPGSLNRPFGTDQRLEPGMVQKRESVGSLADERDYSRKILRVLTLPPHVVIRDADGIGNQPGWELDLVWGCVLMWVLHSGNDVVAPFILASLGSQLFFHGQ